MIGQIRITETYSQLRPLAIHYVSTKAPAVKNAGVAISATVETLWVDGKVGQHVTSADSAIIASETLLINGKHEVTGFGGDAANPGNLKYYVDAAGAFVNWDMYPRFARIPADAPGGSNIGISVSVAEVGTPPKYLKALHRFVADNEGKLSPLLAEAIARQAGVELDE